MENDLTMDFMKLSIHNKMYTTQTSQFHFFQKFGFYILLNEFSLSFFSFYFPKYNLYVFTFVNDKFLFYSFILLYITLTIRYTFMR